MLGWFKKRKQASVAPKDILNPNELTRCVQAGNYPEALIRIDAIIEAASGVALSYRYKGEILFEMERFKESIDAFAEAERIGGVGTEECFFWRGLALANMGDAAGAVTIFHQYMNSPDAVPELQQRCLAAIKTIGN